MEEATGVGAAVAETVVAGVNGAARTVTEEIAEEMRSTLLSILVCSISNRLQDDWIVALFSNILCISTLIDSW